MKFFKLLLLCFQFFLLLCSVIGSISSQIVYDDTDADTLDDDQDSDHLYSRIDCKVGDKHHYVIATQSSLLNDDEENIQMKAKLELECLQKAQWLNETSGQMKPGQIFQIKIMALEPLRKNSTNISKGELQMAALFSALENLGEDPAANGTNVKLGAVNSFFSSLSERFGRWMFEMVRKFIEFLRQWSNKKRSSNSGRIPINLNLECKEDNQIESATIRQRRDAPMNLGQFSANYTDKLRHPFKFIQLEDGSIQNVQISKLDTDPNIIQYKKFIARAFHTQLDERKKTVLENSELGTHYCHYEMEYDEPRESPEQFILNKYQRRNKRHDGDDGRNVDHNSSSSKSDVGVGDSHLVSVMRRFKKEDIIIKAHHNHPADDVKKNNIGLTQLDFNVQEVQLIRDNMVVASGGYFQGFLSEKPDQFRRRRGKSFSQMVQNGNGVDDDDFFDEFLQKHLDLNLQYSMVKLGGTGDNRRQQQRPRRNKRSVIEDDSEPGTTTTKTINYADKIVKRLFSNGIGGGSRTRRRIKREKTNTIEGINGSNNEIVCQNVRRPYDDPTNVRDNNIDPNDDEDFLECYEYKKFGTDILNAHFNRSILVRKGKDKSFSETFETKYKVGAKFFNVNLFMGKMDLKKDPDNTRLNLNLFGSEYVDLNLCDLRDKVFSQSDSIPIYVEDIWFITNVGLKLKYKLDMKFDVPDLKCDSYSSRGDHKIMDDSITNNDDKLKIIQKTNIEFGAVVEASFLILNGQMRLNGQIDMNSLLDVNGVCLTAKSHVNPIDVGVDFNYEFYHPICDKWMKDHWRPKPLSWKLNRQYDKTWTHNNACP